MPITTTTERLRLEPVRPEHAGDLWTLHQDPVVAQWFAGGPRGKGYASGSAGRIDAVQDGAPFALYVAVPG